MIDLPELEHVGSDSAELIDLVASPDVAAAAELDALEATARTLAHDSRARSTWTAYDSDLRPVLSRAGRARRPGRRSRAAAPAAR